MKYNFKTMKSLDKRLSKKEQAEYLGISRPTLDNWLKQFAEEQYIQEKLADYQVLQKLLIEHHETSIGQLIKKLKSKEWVIQK